MDINIAEIARRGGVVESDADFVVVRCIQCEAQFLYEEESLVVYFDPDDLSRRVLNIGGDSLSACPECDDRNWDFFNIESDLEVRCGRWGWVLRMNP